MVDVSEVVDLCDSDDELPSQYVGQSTGIPAVEVFRGSPSEVLPCLARGTIDNAGGIQKKRDSVHLRLQEETRNTDVPGNDDFAECHVRVGSVFSILETSDPIHVSSRKQKTCSTIMEPVVDSEINGKRCVEGIIEIDDDSSDGSLVELPHCESSHRALSLVHSKESTVASLDKDHCGSIEVAGCDQSSTRPSKPHSPSETVSAASQPIFLHSPASSPELRILTPDPDLPPTLPHSSSPKIHLIDDEQLVDLPNAGYPDDDETSPPYSIDDEDDGVGDECGSHTDGDSENNEAQSPRTLYCIYCEYSTVIEEWYHNHIAGHLPGTKPYSRLYCPDCSYSTGSEKYLLFHMYKTHNIKNPKFYRSGEKRYTCRICKHTLELRIDIESHIKKKHKSSAKGNLKQHSRVKVKPKVKQDKTKPIKIIKTKFKCVGLGWDSIVGCSRSMNRVEDLHLHMERHHNIKFPWVHEIVSQFSAGAVEYGCFGCNYKTTALKDMRKHARIHYTRHQLIEPLSYKCPLDCIFICTTQSEILEHFQFVHPSEVPYYQKVARHRDYPSMYACIFCPFVDSSEEQTVSHSAECSKKMM